MKKKTYIFWVICAAAATFRILQTLSPEAPDAYACLKHKVTGTGIVVNDVERKESGQVFNVYFKNLFIVSSSTDTSNSSCAKNILVHVKTKLYPTVKYNEELKITGILSKPFNFSGDNGRKFDYSGLLATNDIFFQIRSAEVQRDVSQNVSTNVSYILYSIKHKFVSNLERVLGEPHAALAAGLVVGEKSALGKDLLDDFRIVGLIHIVVLSGFNITIVAVALRKMLSFLPRVWGITIGAAGIILFGVLVGGGATVVRSCFMASIALLADLIRRDYSMKTALALAALVMLITNPLILLHDPSFQLSFLATVGLILLSSPIEERLHFIPDILGMRGTIASCLATQIFVSPFILYMMGQISLIGIVVNILVLPCIPITMLAIVFTGMSGFFSFYVSQVFGWIAHLLLTYELFMVQSFAKIPYAALQVPTFSLWWVITFYTAFVAVYFSKDKIVELFKKWPSYNFPRSRSS